MTARDDTRTPELVQTVSEEEAIAAAKMITAFLKSPRKMSPTMLRLWMQKVRQAQRTMTAYNRQRRERNSVARMTLTVLKAAKKANRPPRLPRLPSLARLARLPRLPRLRW